MRSILLFLAAILISSCNIKEEKDPNLSAAIETLNRTFGKKNLEQFNFVLNRDSTKLDKFSISGDSKKVTITANSPVALCRGTYHYFKTYCNSIVSWSGSKISLPKRLPVVEEEIETPYQFRYYFNVVTHGYTTPYWDWQRWEQELDWMAVHGMDMPLIGGAHEAILYRVFEKIGLNREEIDHYFSGPAHLPWNRMGNLNGWDNKMPKSYYKKQLELTHKMLDRMKEMEMTPIVHAFAGFVPKSIKRIYPELEIKELGWGGGLPQENSAYILAPDSELFVEIGKLYIEEWEKEFGKGKYYLADSFNEMDVPVSDNHEEAIEQLAGYGKSVYRSIKEANPDAIWVMQGWTFPYHKGADGKLFWTPERLGALVSEVPDNNLLILDLANEYNSVFWRIDPSWKIYEGFFGKQWIYSFIPNMGGKVPLNGRLDIYASTSIDALNYEQRKNLVGFGFAPEGIENNEIIYELLADMGWRDQKIDLNSWIESYSTQRYGSFPGEMKIAFDQLNNSAFGSFTDHPMHRYQFRPYHKPEGVEDHATVHRSEEFNRAVGTFLSCYKDLNHSDLYRYDAIELAVQYFGLEVDKMLLESIAKDDKAILDQAVEIMTVMDRLLATHPNHRLDRWVNFARNWGDNSAEKDYYESNAKRIVTTWGGDPVNDYSGRVWSGLIRDYYIPRWIKFHNAAGEGRDQMRNWEESWITTPGVSTIEPYQDPVKIALELYNKLIN